MEEIQMTRKQTDRKEWDRTISLKLTKDSIRRNYIYIPSRYRNLFPPYKKEFSLETDAGKLSVYITSEKNLGYGLKVKEESDAGTKIYGKKKILGKWYEKHSEVENGDTIIIEEIEPNKKYRLGIVRWP
jgi:hypothetical protein